MAKNFIQPGETIAVTAPATIASGDPVLVGNLFGVAVADAASGATVQISTRGVFSLPKKATDTIDQGQVVYFNATDKITETATSSYRVGVAVEAAGNGVTTCKVRLDGVATIQEAAGE